ncbi:MAG: sensor histidine kinase N-terminal domain-containing protein [Rhodobacteraceae bacterium]|nr:sensor histidine kinase N-terminal domain-containing protein [Paracoccaceae bacterium]
MRAPRPPISLTARLAFAGLLIVVVGGLLVTFLAWTYGQRAAQEAFDRLLLGAADQISASIRFSDSELLVDLPTTAFDLLALSRNDRVVYRVARATGETLTGYDQVAFPDALNSQQFYDGEITGEAARFVALPRYFAERDFSGSTITIVGHTRQARNALAWDIMQNAWFILLLAGFGMTALALFAIRSALEPLRRVSHHLLALDPDDLAPIALNVPRELTAFITAFNRFAGRIDRQMQVMQDFIADSAHQLRTPIAALRATTRNAVEDAQNSEVKHELEKIDAQAVRLGHLTDQLLSHALVIHRADAGKLVPLDLRQVAIDSVDIVDVLVPKGQHIRLELPESPLMIDGDTLSLVEAVKNLMSNALNHGEPPFEIEVVKIDNTARLHVRDHGAGVSAAGWRQNARRFSREPGRSGVGGLGLAIVRSVALAHGAQIEVSKGSDAFQVTLVFSLKQDVTGEDPYD